VRDARCPLFTPGVAGSLHGVEAGGLHELVHVELVLSAKRAKLGILTSHFGRAGLEAAPGHLEDHLLLLREDDGFLVSLGRRLILVGLVVRHVGYVGWKLRR
jgi:hypothetical protein